MSFSLIEAVKESNGIIGPYGDKFGRLLVLSLDHIEYGRKGRVYYFDRCRCDCGNEIIVNRLSYTQRQRMSCGCITRSRLEKNKRPLKTYNKPPKSRHELYITHHSIIQKCYNNKSQHYRKFGGVGVKVCDRWKDSFEEFVADVESEIGPRPNNESFFTRIDRSGNFEPGNIRWATSTQLNAEKRKPKHKPNWYSNFDEVGIGYIGNICFDFE